MSEPIDNSFLEIDKLRLDQEWLGQPLLMKEWSDKCAEARRVLGWTEAQRDLVEAETSLAVRRAPDKYDLTGNVTESAIKTIVSVQKALLQWNSKVRVARHRLDVCVGAVNALEHRKRALTELVELHGQDYFSNPRVTSSAKLRDVVRNGAEEAARQRTRASLGKLQDLKKDKKEDR